MKVIEARAVRSLKSGFPTSVVSLTSADWLSPFSLEVWIEKMDAAQYLRKSRMEEGLDTEEVLAKHRKALAEYAKANDIHIIETYYEVVSGESLYARPEMLRLLEDVEEGRYDAVLVMDLDRLSRGRMKDQGIILDAFRDSDTLIITPEHTYNLSDDLDDEMAEFKTSCPAGNTRSSTSASAEV